MYTPNTFKRDTIPVINQRTINSTAGFKDFHLSYNQSSADYGNATTAIVLKDRVFFVIDGDHRKALYEAAEVSGIQGCIEYFIANIAQANKLSEHHMVIGVSKDVFNLNSTALEVIGQSNIDLITEAAAKLSD